jgi:predicted ester cyclase
MIRTFPALASLALCVGCSGAALAPATAPSSTEAADQQLVTPQVVIEGAGLTPERGRAAITAARRFYTFWDTGDPAFLEEAISPAFIDRTLPPGRPQGAAGPRFASRNFRMAVPDLHCEVTQLLIVGDRVVAHLHFRGRFTGTFGEHHGDGARVDFIATDILRVEGGRVTDNWHIEDNLTLMHQLGVIT